MGTRGWVVSEVFVWTIRDDVEDCWGGGNNAHHFRIAFISYFEIESETVAWFEIVSPLISVNRRSVRLISELRQMRWDLFIYALLCCSRVRTRSFDFPHPIWIIAMRTAAWPLIRCAYLFLPRTFHGRGEGRRVGAEDCGWEERKPWILPYAKRRLTPPFIYFLFFFGSLYKSLCSYLNALEMRSFSH